MLEGMSRIEAEAYTLLAQLGATPVSRVLTAGGGAVNDKWTAMRAAALGVPVAAAAQGGKGGGFVRLGVGYGARCGYVLDHTAMVTRFKITGTIAGVQGNREGV